MKQRAFFKVMSFVGAMFALFLVSGYVKTLKTQGDIIENKITVPAAFSRQFSHVQTRNRYEAMPKATFMSPEGRRANWRVFQDKYLLVNFWASWCAPCVVELPSLDKLQQKFAGKGLEVIAVSMDTRRDQEQIKAFLFNRNIGDFAAYFDDAGEVHSAISMRGLPTTYLLGPKGNILYIFEGDASWDSPAAVEFFQSVLDQNSP